MWRIVSTEVQGWLDALSDPPVLTTILWRLLAAMFFVAAGILGASQPAATVAGVVLAVLLFCLVRLRLFGSP
jgi:hypothetical protein